MKIENKFPGKDVSHEDMETKFPLVAKKNDSHKSKFTISGVEFGGEGHVGVAVREGSHVGEGGHVVALVVHRGVDSPFFDVDDDVVVGVVDDA